MVYWRGLFKLGAGLKQLSGFFKQFSHHWEGWSRSNETKHAARSYLMGIILPGKRKNMSSTSRRVRLDMNIIQQFLTDSPWDPIEVMKTVIHTISNKIASEKGVIIVDDTGQKKKGQKSPGVNRQYSGTLGKIGNCQIAVGCCYSIPGEVRNADAVYCPTGMQLYIPKEWFEDEKKCKEAGIPDSLDFQTKPEISLNLIKRILKEKVPHRAITADTAYGTNGNFRRELREQEEPYVLAVIPSEISIVPEDTSVIPAETKSEDDASQKHTMKFPKGVKTKTADIVAGEISDDDWEEVEWSEGTKGKLSAQFTRMRVRVTKFGKPTDETGWMLFEKTKDGELKVYMCRGLDNASLEELVSIAHIRWTIEQCFKQMKRELGLDKFEGRKWKGWHHHAAMVMLAFCYLMLLRVEEASPGEKLPTLPQVRREILRIYVRQVFERRLKIPPDEADAILDDIPFLVPE